MRILILEDEPPIAEYIASSVRSILNEQIRKLTVLHSIEEALDFLSKNQIDLLFLDLNLSGEDGFEILQDSLSRRFQTIVISAYTDRAINAYEYGVIDFVPKTLKKERLKIAIERYMGRSERPEKTKYLISKIKNKNKVIPVSDIVYLQADRYLVYANCINQKKYIIEKPLNSLEIILPKNFIRTHRSYIVNVDYVELYDNSSPGVFHVRMKDQTRLPLSRRRVKFLKEQLS